MNGNSEVQLYIIIALITQHIENRSKTKEYFPKTDKLIKETGDK
jgi:hypothetical protein